jgi:hypothetical protein
MKFLKMLILCIVIASIANAQSSKPKKVVASKSNATNNFCKYTVASKTYSFAPKEFSAYYNHETISNISFTTYKMYIKHGNPKYPNMSALTIAIETPNKDKPKIGVYSLGSITCIMDATKQCAHITIEQEIDADNYNLYETNSESTGVLEITNVQGNTIEGKFSIDVVAENGEILKIEDCSFAITYLSL